MKKFNKIYPHGDFRFSTDRHIFSIHVSLLFPTFDLFGDNNKNNNLISLFLNKSLHTIEDNIDNEVEESILFICGSLKLKWNNWILHYCRFRAI